MPRFSRTQLGVILLLGAGLFLIWAWRGNFGLPPAAPVARTLNPVFVEVAGKVPKPGVYTFPGPPTLSQVLAQAGGVVPQGQEETKITSGSKIEITPDGQLHLGGMDGARLLTLGLALDLNQATAADLEALPGIGPVIAKRIIAYRQAHGPFKKVADLENVSGIGPKKLEKIKPYLLLVDRKAPPSDQLK